MYIIKTHVIMVIMNVCIIIITQVITNVILITDIEGKYFIF